MDKINPNHSTFPDHLSRGITIRAQFAKDAPPVPDWFMPVERGSYPDGPAGMEEYREALAVRFYRWRTSYADNLIAELNKGKEVEHG